jgi:hypothetical protein
MIKKGNWVWQQYPKLNNFITWITQRLYGGGTFGINWDQKITRWSITSVQIDHAFSIALTALIGVLMYLDFHSLWAVLLWTSSSITTHISCWLNGRRYAVVSILALLMVACFHAGGWWLIAALPMFIVTPLFHMTAICSPVLYPPMIPVIALILFLFRKRLLSHYHAKEKAIVLCSRKDYNLKRLIVIIKSYGFYFFKMIFPMMTRTNYNFLYMWGVTQEGDKDAYSYNKDFVKGTVALGLSVIAVIYLPVAYKGYVVFMALSTLQWCNIINLTQIVADRYIVLTNVFMQVILAWLLPWWACASIVAVNICFTSMAYRMYENIQGMFDYHFYHWPQYSIVNKEYIQICWQHGNYVKMSYLTMECLRFNPKDWDLLWAAALCAKKANDRPLCRKYLELAEQHLYYGHEDTQKKIIGQMKASI